MLSRPSSLNRPHPPVEETPHPFPFPVTGWIFDIHGSSCLFLTPSGLSLLNFHRLPPPLSRRLHACISVLPHRHWPSGNYHTTLGVYQHSHNSALGGVCFSRLHTVVRFRCSPRYCSPPWLIRPEAVSRPQPTVASTSQFAGY